MKKLVLILAILVVASGTAFAQLSDSATLFLSGTVGDFVAIDVTPAPAATSLALSAGQATPLQVGTVTESSNTAYEVTVTSANSFNFSDGTNSLPYTLYYDGVTVGTAAVSSGATASGLTRPVSVTFPAAGTTAATGTYSDTVTFTISTQ